jgi:transposase-like protein
MTKQRRTYSQEFKIDAARLRCGLLVRARL